jgi:hypothetical protein
MHIILVLFIMFTQPIFINKMFYNDQILEILNGLIKFSLFLMGKFNSKVEQIESRTAFWNGLCSTLEGPLYNKTSIKRNFSPSNKIHREVGRAKDPCTIFRFRQVSLWHSIVYTFAKLTLSYLKSLFTIRFTLRVTHSTVVLNRATRPQPPPPPDSLCKYFVHAVFGIFVLYRWEVKQFGYV